MSLLKNSWLIGFLNKVYLNNISVYDYMEHVRDKVYYWCLDLMKLGKELEAIILLLATWNFANFRYHMDTLDLKKFRKKLKQCNFKYFKNRRFETVNFDDVKLKRRIMGVYGILSKIKGIRYVGATKIMHLECPSFFVMWDARIRQYYHCGTSPTGYINFMKKMQGLYKRGKFKKWKGETIPRSIDLHNIHRHSIGFWN